MTYEPYPQYPAGPPIPPPPPKPAIPSTVTYAFYLMLTGAALSLIGGVIGLFRVSSIRSAIRSAITTQHPEFSKTQIDNATNIGVMVAIVMAIVIGLLGVALWVWMAFANRAGKNWARITASVFFGLNTLFVLIGLAVAAVGTSGSASTSPANIAINTLGWLVGLVTVILLWLKQSGPYFKQPEYPYPMGYPPAYPGMPGPPPSAPQQAYPAAPEPPQADPIWSRNPPQPPSESQSDNDSA